LSNWWSPRNRARKRLGPRMDDPVRLLLLWFILAVWFLAGLDYFCHRGSDIAHTSGWKESVLHLAMFAEVAVPLLVCLFFEINALIFASAPRRRKRFGGAWKTAPSEGGKALLLMRVLG